LVSTDALLDAVWAGTVVRDTVLKSCIRELREALGDKVQAPQYIATVHRRGYRFIAPLITQPGVGSQYPVVNRKQPEASPLQLATNHWQLTTPLVGREAELAQLHGWLEKALAGERRLVFVTGEPGIGKTTLVDAFLQTLDARRQTLAISFAVFGVHINFLAKVFSVLLGFRLAPE
jgi:hypothetical protein